MRQSSYLARGLALVASLSLVSPLALAAPPRHKKAARPSKKSETAPPDEANKASAPAEETTPQGPPEPAPEAPEAQSSTPSNAAPAASAPAAVVELNPSPAPASEAPESSDDARVGRREAARLAAGRVEVAVALSAGVGGRRFAYSDPIGHELAPYRLPVAPLAGVELEAYPAASTDVPVLRDLGLRGRVSRAFAFDSNTPQGVTLQTSWTRFGGELRQRVLVPSSHPFELGISAGADASYFGMTAKARVPALLPAARTIALRFGFDTKLRLAWRLSLLLGGAYLAVTSRGEIYEQLRSPHLAGVDSDGGFALGLGSGLEARLIGRYTRYFGSFEPALGDRYVAGGALDEQWQVGLGVRYAH